MAEPGRQEVPISPSVQAIRNLGGVSSSVAETKKLEFRSELPDVRMQQSSFDADKDPKKVAEDRAKVENYLRHLERGGELFGDEESIKAGSEAGYVGSFIRNIRELQEIEPQEINNKVEKKTLTSEEMEKLKAEAEKEAEKEKDKIREKIAEAYLHINHIELDEMDTVNGFLERLRNGFPYDTRWSIQMFEQLEKRVNATLREKGERKIIGEGREILRVFKRDARWAVATARMSEAMGASGELYYDGELKLQRLRTTHGEVLASDFVRAYKKELKGLTLTPQEKELTKKILGEIPEGYIEDVDRYKNLKEKSLREVAIEYQDAFDHWMLAGTAAGQRNLENGFVNDSEAGEHYMDIDKAEFRFLNEVLDANRDIRNSQENNLTYINSKGEKVVVKKSLLNPFCMPRDDERAQQAYQARMHELVVNHEVYEKALDAIRKMPEGNDEEKEQKVLEIIKEADKLVEASNKQIADWENLDVGHPFDKLAYTVMSNQINLERGVLGSGDLGWGWEYKRDIVEYKVYKDAKDEYVVYKDEDENEERKYKVDLTEDGWRELIGKKSKSEQSKIIQKDGYGNTFMVERESELGSIYDNHDVTTVYFWARHIIEYDKMADTRGTLLFPTIGWYRKLWESQPPYWRPKLEDLAEDDHLLLGRLGLDEGSKGVLSKNNFLEKQIARKMYEKGKSGWQNQLYGKLDEKVKEYVKENMWAFVTCWLSEPGKGSDEYNLVLPVFLQTYIEDINFWRTTSLVEASAKIKDHGKESIWHQRLKGIKLSELNWENMPKYKYNWVEVNHDQMERWFGPWVTPQEFNKYTGDEHKKHNSMPSGLSEKESGKRGRLGSRGSRWADGVIRAAVLVQSKILASVANSNVMSGEKGLLQKTVETTRSDGTVIRQVKNLSIDQYLDEWRYKWVSPWLNTLLDMPTKVRSVENYPGTSAQMLILTYLQVRRIIASAIIHSEGQKADTNNSLRAIEKNFVM